MNKCSQGPYKTANSAQGPVNSILCTGDILTGRTGAPLAVFRIRIHVFLGLLDPDPDPLVRGMDPDTDRALDPDPSIIKQI